MIRGAPIFTPCAAAGVGAVGVGADNRRCQNPLGSAVVRTRWGLTPGQTPGQTPSGVDAGQVVMRDVVQQDETRLVGTLEVEQVEAGR